MDRLTLKSAMRLDLEHCGLSIHALAVRMERSPATIYGWLDEAQDTAHIPSTALVGFISLTGGRETLRFFASHADGAEVFFPSTRNLIGSFAEVGHAGTRFMQVLAEAISNPTPEHACEVERCGTNAICASRAAVDRVKQLAGLSPLREVK